MDSRWERQHLTIIITPVLPHHCWMRQQMWWCPLPTQRQQLYRGPPHHSQLAMGMYVCSTGSLSHHFFLLILHLCHSLQFLFVWHFCTFGNNLSLLGSNLFFVEIAHSFSTISTSQCTYNGCDWHVSYTLFLLGFFFSVVFCLIFFW